MLFTKGEIVALTITGIEAVAIAIGMNTIRKVGKKKLEKIYGTSNLNEIMRMTAEEAKEKGLVH